MGFLVWQGTKKRHSYGNDKPSSDVIDAHIDHYV